MNWDTTWRNLQTPHVKITAWAAVAPSLWCLYQNQLLQDAASKDRTRFWPGEEVFLAPSETWNPFSSGCSEASVHVVFGFPQSAGQVHPVFVGTWLGCGVWGQPES